jgi:hypothetical protein
VRIDRELESRVNAALAAVPELDRHHLEVEVAWHVVTLRGTVEDMHTRELARQVVSRVPGVARVLNCLSVKPDWAEEHPPHQTEFATTKAAEAATSPRFKPGDGL